MLAFLKNSKNMIEIGRKQAKNITYKYFMVSGEHHDSLPSTYVRGRLQNVTYI